MDPDDDRDVGFLVLEASPWGINVEEEAVCLKMSHLAQWHRGNETRALPSPITKSSTDSSGIGCMQLNP